MRDHCSSGFRLANPTSCGSLIKILCPLDFGVLMTTDQQIGSQKNLPDGSNQIAKAIKTIQIIRGALILGPLIFLLVALFLVNGEIEFKFEIIDIAALFFGLQALAFFVFAEKLFINKPVENWKSLNHDEKQSSLIQRVTQLQIIKGAMLEGVTFFGFILIIISQSGVGLSLGVFMIIIALMTFPTRYRLENQLESLRYAWDC